MASAPFHVEEPRPHEPDITPDGQFVFQLLDCYANDESWTQSPECVEIRAKLARHRQQLQKDGKPASFAHWALACEDLNLTGKMVMKSHPQYDQVSKLSKEYRQKEQGSMVYTIHLFGITPGGCSVHISVVDYQPYFFIELGQDHDEVARRVTLAEALIRHHTDKSQQSVSSVSFAELELSMVSKMKFFGYQDGQPTQFLRIQCPSFRSRSQIRSLFQTSDGHLHSFEGITFPVYEYKLPPFLRFLHEKNASPVGWLSIPMDQIQWGENEIGLTGCVGTVLSRWVTSLPERQGEMAPLLMASFDLECHSEDGSFPVATRPDNRVTQIGLVTQWFHPPPGCTDRICRYIWVLNGCTPIPDAQVIACTTERQLLLSFAAFVQQLDPDLLIGYNIYGFDWNYLYLRAKLLGADVEDMFCRLSRMDRLFRIEKTDKSSAAMGDNEWYVIPTPGRVQMDLLVVIKRDEQLASYKLDDVAFHFLGQNKHDVSPRQIWALQAGSDDDRRVVAEYCLQDCLLPLRLLHKLDMVVKKMGMAHVCSVPLSFIIDRGQGIKCYSLVTQYCLGEHYLLRDLFVDIRLDEKDDTDTNENLNDNINDSGTGYAGAIVLQPQIGAHFKPVTVNDFNSLYPSASISHNLCPSTMVSSTDLAQYLDRPDIVIWTIRWRDIQSRDPDEWPTLLGNPEFDFRSRGPYPEVEYVYDNVRWKRWEAPMNPTVEYPPTIRNDITDMVAASPIREYHFVQPSQVQWDDERTRPGRGIVPKILIQLLEARKKYKNLMEEEPDPFRAAVLNGLQLSYKVTANSLYGQMGASTSAIRCEAVASSITATGRMLLLISRQTILREFPASRVVYGDTDSLFVQYPLQDHTDPSGQADQVAIRQEAIEYGNRLESVMKKILVWPHKLAYEKVYDPFLLLNKKKYTGLLYENNPAKVKKTDSKGLINKRRDNAPIVQTIYGRLIKTLLQSKNADAAIQQLRTDLVELLEGKIDMEQLVISKTLKKEYRTPTPPAHKVLADRMMKRDPGSAPQVGDRVPFVFVVRPSGKGLGWSKQIQGDLVEHPGYLKEVNRDKTMIRIDYLYYLEHQLRKPLLEILLLFHPQPAQFLNDLELKYSLRRSGQSTIEQFFVKGQVK